MARTIRKIVKHKKTGPRMPKAKAKIREKIKPKKKIAVKKQVKKMAQKQTKPAVKKQKPAPVESKPVVLLPRVRRGDGKVRACVLYGFGINCDYETAHAFASAGAIGERVHVNDLITGARTLREFEILAFPGGFSFGDDLGSGKVLANKFKFHLQDELQQFVKDGMLVAGICNGFQSIAKLGLLPAFAGHYKEQTTTLTFNDSSRFEDRWVRLAFDKKNPCVWTKGIERMYLPVRHGEGKFAASELMLKKLDERHLAVAKYADSKWKPTMEYPDNPNGSMHSIAAACDETGRVFGIMPHPEAFTDETNHPRWTRGSAHEENGLGLQVFENAVKYAREKLI
jgi:phosphoribosylformylglycinamidine synthase